jgi:hypothetical protein
MRFDLLVTPTLSILPLKLASADELLEARCTLPVNLAGVPALILRSRLALLIMRYNLPRKNRGATGAGAPAMQAIRHRIRQAR